MKISSWDLAAILAAVLASPAGASAHAFLDRALPGAGATVPPPSELRLTFTEAVEPSFSSVTLQAQDGARIPTAAPKAAEDGQQLVLALPPLSAGTYTVTWHVTSVDTHKTEGRFQFTVAR
jgi:hypothetical protein